MSGKFICSPAFAFTRVAVRAARRSELSGAYLPASMSTSYPASADWTNALPKYFSFKAASHASVPVHSSVMLFSMNWRRSSS